MLHYCRWVCVTCDGRQGSRVGVGQRHTFFIWLRQIGVTAELLFLGQLEGDKDHGKRGHHTSQELNILLLSHAFTCNTSRFSIFVPFLIFSYITNSYPSAIQRTGPFSFLCDEDHAAPFLFLLTLSHFYLCFAHRDHAPLLHCTYTNTATGAWQGGRVPGAWRLRRDVPGRRQEGVD